MFIAIVFALLINNLIIYFIASHALNWKVLRIAEEFIKEASKCTDDKYYDTSRACIAISIALSNSVGSKHDR